MFNKEGSLAYFTAACLNLQDAAAHRNYVAMSVSKQTVQFISSRFLNSRVCIDWKPLLKDKVRQIQGKYSKRDSDWSDQDKSRFLAHFISK